MKSFFKTPSAWIPFAMSFAAIALVLWYAVFAVPAEPGGDEGFAARLFQLLLAAQAPVMAAFGIKWLPREQKRAVWILSLQVLLALFAVGLVIFLEL